MSSFLARGRDEVVVERDVVLVPELIKDSSREVKARVFEELISRDDFCFFAGLGAPYKGASFADVFLYDIVDYFGRRRQLAG